MLGKAWWYSGGLGVLFGLLITLSIVEFFLPGAVSAFVPAHLLFLLFTVTCGLLIQVSLYE